MKTQSFFRVSTLLLLFIAASLASCKKGDNTDPSPDLAARVAGTYTYSEIVAAGQTYPASETNLRGTIILSRQSATTVGIQLAIVNKLTNEAFADDSADDVTVVEANSGNIDLRYNGNVIAKIKGNKISVEGEDEAGTSFTLMATK